MGGPVGNVSAELTRKSKVKGFSLLDPLELGPNLLEDKKPPAPPKPPPPADEFSPILRELSRQATDRELRRGRRDSFLTGRSRTTGA